MTQPADSPPTFTAWPCSPGTLYRGLYLGTAGHIRRKTGRVRARFDFPAVGFVVAGHGTYASGRGAPVVVGPGTVFGVYPGPVFDYGPQAWWEEYYVGFDGPGAAALVDSGLIPTGGPRGVGGVGGVERAVRAFRDLLRLKNRAATGDADRACLAGLRLLLDLFDAPRSPAPVDAIEPVLAACRSRMREPIDFVRLAKQHGISYSLLRQRVRRRTGLAPAKYLTHLRCEAARVLLATTALPIHRVARDVGIADPYAFSRTFRRTTGLSPQAYRAGQCVYDARASTE